MPSVATRRRRTEQADKRQFDRMEGGGSSGSYNNNYTASSSTSMNSNSQLNPMWDSNSYSETTRSFQRSPISTIFPYPISSMFTFTMASFCLLFTTLSLYIPVATARLFRIELVIISMIIMLVSGWDTKQLKGKKWAVGLLTAFAFISIPITSFTY